MGAVSQSDLRCCVPGLSPQFCPPNKTWLSNFRLCILFQSTTATPNLEGGGGGVDLALHVCKLFANIGLNKKVETLPPEGLSWNVPWVQTILHSQVSAETWALQGHGWDRPLHTPGRRLVAARACGPNTQRGGRAWGGAPEGLWMPALRVWGGGISSATGWASLPPPLPEPFYFEGKTIMKWKHFRM